MIIVKLMGGLGNQMFQYAVGRHLALKNNTILKLDLNFLLDRTYRKNFTYRNYELGIFNIQSDIAAIEEISKFKLNENQVYSFIKHRLKISNVFKEYFIYNYKDVLNAPENSYLDGYWQSERYFKEIGSIIRNDFTFRCNAEGKNIDLIKEISSLDSVSIHIRRGDYVYNTSLNKIHGTCSLEYYLKAVELISERLSNPVFYVFSDDSNWAKENIDFKYPTKFITHNVGNKNYEDLRLMSCCKHNIIANSSFSWWGAWLNNNPDKIVIAPHNWFNDKSVKINDLIPENWIKIM